MKKSILIAVVFIIGVYANAVAGAEPTCYVKTSQEVYFGQKLKIGFLNTKIIAEDGKIVKVPSRKVKSYSDGSRFFELLPTVNNEYDTTGYRIMECIKSKNGFKLFAFYNSELENPGKELYVFTDQRMYLKIDLKNAANVLAFFGIESL